MRKIVAIVLTLVSLMVLANVALAGVGESGGIRPTRAISSK